MTSGFVFSVSDIDADSWRAEVAVAADTRTEAYRILRGRGVHRKQFDNEGRPIRELALADVGGWLMDPTGVYRRGDDAVGWSAWEPVPDDVSLDWRISGKARRRGPGGHILLARDSTSRRPGKRCKDSTDEVQDRRVGRIDEMTAWH